MIFSIMLLLCSFNISLAQFTFKITEKEIRDIGNKIWFNESAATIKGLTCWNNNEEFASMGIGHFIWYPSSEPMKFGDTFHSFLAFAQNKEEKLPSWLAPHTHCPWRNQKEFLSNLESKKMKELRTFLKNTIHLQAQFIIDGFQEKVATLLQKNSKRQKHLLKQIQRLQNSPQGLYAMIDYLNFKGSGLDIIPDYQDHQWGLLQVLNNMKGTKPGPEAVQEFCTIALDLLQKRIAVAPKHRREQQWLTGWHNRLKTYLKT